MTGASPEHRSRHGWLGRSVVWRLDATTLSMTNTDRGIVRTLGLQEIRELRLCLMPSRFWEHHVCELQLTDGSRLWIGDDYVKFVVWKVSSKETYREFVTALCAALASKGLQCRFRTGPREPDHLLLMLAVIAAIYVITQFLVVHVGMSKTDGNWFFSFGCVLVLLKSPYWRRVNRPTEFDPTKIPDGLLPDDAAGPAGVKP